MISIETINFYKGRDVSPYLFHFVMGIEPLRIIEQILRENALKSIDYQFISYTESPRGIITMHRERKLRSVDEESLQMSWMVGRSETTQMNKYAIVQSRTAQLPAVLNFTKLTNHIEILDRCKTPKNLWKNSVHF